MLNKESFRRKNAAGKVPKFPGLLFDT